MTNKRILSELRKHCMAFTGATEDYPWEEHVGWKFKSKLFAIGGEDSNRVTVKSTLDKQAALVEIEGVEKAAYVGRFGWVTVTVTDEPSLDLAKNLIDESYAMVANPGAKKNSTKAKAR